MRPQESRSSERLESDVVIVGSGVAGALIAYRLAAAGVKVLVLEAGPRIDRAQAVLNFRKDPYKGPNSAYPTQPYAPQPVSHDIGAYYVQEGPEQFEVLYARAVGGTTWHFGGTALRFHPNDFILKSKFGVGVDWPIGYADLEKFYGEAEDEIGVAGDSSFDFGSPRSTPYPMPVVPPTYSDLLVKKAAATVGLSFRPFPQARNTIERDGRPPCCGNATCHPVCPIHAKYDASGTIDKAEKAGAQVVAEAVAHHVEVGADQRVTAIRFKRPDGSERVATGRIFVLACHAIETPKLLLMSRSERLPNGVANSSDQVGRNLLTQVDQGVRGLAREPLYPYRGPVVTSGIVEYRDGEFRGERAAVGMSAGNQGWHALTGPLVVAQRLASQGMRGEELAAAVRDHASREVEIGTSAELLPDPSNRVLLADDRRDALGLPRPRIRLQYDDYARRGLAFARGVQDRLMAALGATDITQLGPNCDNANMAGTCRMGDDSKTSVVDPDLRAHDHPNLFIVGSATFPTISAMPVTLTIAAISLRAAARIGQEVG